MLQILCILVMSYLFFLSSGEQLEILSRVHINTSLQIHVLGSVLAEF